VQQVVAVANLAESKSVWESVAPLTLLSVMVSMAVRVPAAWSVFVIFMVQLAPGANELGDIGQVFDSMAKSPLFAPPNAMLETVNAAVPMLLSVMGTAALVVFRIGLRNCTAGGFTLATGPVEFTVNNTGEA
jgi:hypothetical protein